MQEDGTLPIQLSVGDLMKDDNKTKKQLVHALIELRSQNAVLEKSMTGSISAELAAEEARRYAENIVETVREPLLVLDADLKIISANRDFYRTFKVTPGETIGSFIYDLGNKQWNIPALRELLEEILPKKQAFDDFEVAHHFQDIGHKIMLLNARQIYRKDIGAELILLAIEDVTEHKRLEKLLTEAEGRYRRVYETASDGIVFLEHREGKITHANLAIKKMLGYTKKKIIGSKLQDIGILLDMGDFQATMQNLGKSGITNYDDVPVKTKSGQYIDTDIYLANRARLIQCNIRDISDRKRIERSLVENEARLRALVQTIPDLIWLKDAYGIYLACNTRFEHFFGAKEADIVGKTDYDFVDKELADFFREHDRKAMAAGKPTSNEEWITFADDGHCALLDTIKMPMYDAPGKLVGVLGIGRDITERKRAEDMLRISEGRYRIVEDIGHVGNWEYNLQTTKFWGSDEAKRLYGFDPEALDFSTDEVENCIPERERVHQALVDLIEADKPYSLEFEIHPKNSLKPRIISSVAELKRDEHGNPLLVTGFIQDITERKQAEEKLQQTLDRLRKAVETTIQVMVSATEVRDPYTAGHQIRSADLARAIATEMGLPQDRIDGIRMAGSIHDIGKLSIPSEILSKPTKLSEIEFSLIKDHSRSGYEMLKDVESPWPLAEIVYQHHERMDGSGYPRNLKGDEILMEARILGVADVVEAMASHRPYRASLGIDAALEELENNRAILYDADVVDACLRLFREKDWRLKKARY